jgi:excinuclease ABC subunit B
MIIINQKAQINEEIERLRNATTQSLWTRKDVLIVASVSCIYGLGNPEDFNSLKIDLEVGGIYKFQKIARRLIDLQFIRTNLDLKRGYFRIVGDTIEIYPVNEDGFGYRFSFFGDELEEISRFNILSGKAESEKLQDYSIFPAKQYVTTKEKIDAAIVNIEKDVKFQTKYFEAQGKLLQAQRIKDRTSSDVEMLQEMGFCNGIENYSSYFENRPDGQPPTTLLDYFPDDSLCFIDESHITLPQIGAMHAGDKSRKETLVEYGFRLPSAMNNRPLKRKEFFDSVGQIVYVSATPNDWELGYGEFEE